MSRENIINKHQRGLLKDMIISKDKRILECLKQYDLDGDQTNLYKNCLNLVTFEDEN